ncbi:MAG: hypothetical protein AB2823_18490 [Candidatus Thiodiazotropha endolucinida]
MSKSKCELPLTHAKTSQLLIINTQERLTKAMPKLDLDQMVTNIVKLS